MTNLAPLHDNDAPTGNELVTANIRGALGYLGKKQADLATAIGISEMSLSRRMSPHHAAEFSASEILAAAEFLELEAGDLFATRQPRGGSSGRLVGVGATIHRFVGRTGLEPVTDGSWVDREVVELDEYRARKAS